MAKSGGSKCQAEACALQDCLQANTYSPEKCDRHVRRLYECCQDMYTASSGKAESTACPQPSIVERWLKNHKEKP